MPEEGTISARTEMSYNLLWGVELKFWEPNSGPLEDQQALLTTELSFQSQGSFLSKSKNISCVISFIQMTNSLRDSGFYLE